MTPPAARAQATGQSWRAVSPGTRARGKTNAGTRAPMPYHRFRCSVGFTEAREIVLAESRARYAREGQCIRPTRSRILGKMHQIKLEEYAGYVRWLRGGGR